MFNICITRIVYWRWTGRRCYQLIITYSAFGHGKLPWVWQHWHAWRAMECQDIKPMKPEKFHWRRYSRNVSRQRWKPQKATSTYGMNYELQVQCIMATAGLNEWCNNGTLHLASMINPMWKPRWAHLSTTTMIAGGRRDIDRTWPISWDLMRSKSARFDISSER